MNCDKRRSLTRVRNPGNRPKNNFGSFHAPMCADTDAHYGECHGDLLKVGIVDEVSDSKFQSRFGMVVSTSAIYQSNPFDEPENSTLDYKTITSNLGKW